LYVRDELAYDKVFKNTENTFRLLGNNFFVNRKPDSNHPARFADEILKSIPEITSLVKLKFSDVNIGYGENNQIVENVLYADSNFFSFFNWPLIQGNQNTVLSEPMSVVISQRKAKEFFGDQNPIGKTIKMDNYQDLTITGVFENFPKQSHIKTEIVIPYTTFFIWNQQCLESWGCFNCTIYLKSVSNVTKIDLDKKLTALWNGIKDKNGGATGDNVHLIAQPFKDIYLHSGDYSERCQYSSITNIRVISIITIFILIIACFNFVNLATAIMGKRNIETGVSKVLGAGKRILTAKIINEVSAYILISWIFCFISVYLLLPSLNNYLDKNFSIGWGNLLPLLLFIVVISLIILLAISIYPVILANRTNISAALKGRASSSFIPGKHSTFSRGTIRDSMVIVQFTFGIILILLSVTINKQMQFIRHRNIGFDKDQLLIIQNTWEPPMVERFQKLKQRLEKYSQIKIVSCGKNVPGTIIDNWAGGVGLVSVDNDYFTALDIDFIEGRGFREGEADMNNIIITENLLKLIREDQPEGELPDIPLNDKKYKIIGIVKDIEFNTIHSETKPTLFYLKDSYDYSLNIIIRLAGGNISDGLSIIEKEWEKIAPNWPLAYYFMDDRFEMNYRNEARISKLINALTFVSLFLCCLGLFGLSLYTINGRIKEIGIRKINGAKVSEVMTMLNRDFVKWVLIAFIIACPIAYYAMHKWLQNFAYRTNLSWWVFAAAGAAAVAVALITVSWQSWRAATRNPVEALRYE
jgi:putative ABC transport system permease protein